MYIFWGSMNDTMTTIDDLKKRVSAFIAERDWLQFHDPKNDSMCIAIEAAELMEIFRWAQSTETFEVLERNREAVEQEVADIAFMLFSFCNIAHIDMREALEKKMTINEQRYPVEQCKGRSDKYTAYKKVE